MSEEGELSEKGGKEEQASNDMPQESGEGTGKSKELGKKSTGDEAPLKPSEEGTEESEDGDSELEEDDVGFTYYSTMKYDKSSNYTGLSNQGATCYLNSLIQTMFMTPEIRLSIFEWRYDENLHGSADRSIPLQLQILFAKLQLSKKRAVSTEKLTKSFGWNRTQAFVQHDVNELCRVLFDALDKTFAPNLYKRNEELKKCKTEEETKEIGEKYDKLVSENGERFISDMYRGEYVDYVLAKDFKDDDGEEIGRKRRDNYLDIQLVIRKLKSVEEAMKNFSTPEVLDGDNQWFCEQLEKKVDAIKGLKFSRFPPILTLNLKRFDYNPITWTREKLGHRVTFPFLLDASPFIDKRSEGGKECLEYELFSVLIHSGNARMGHYYAYIKSFEDGKWYKYNDQDVKEIDESEVKKMYGTDETTGANSTNAYMLMYRSVELERVKKIDDAALPEKVRAKILEKNEKVQKYIEYNKKKKMYCVCRFYTNRREHVDTCRCKRSWPIAKLTLKLHERLTKKFPQNYGPDTAVPLDCFRIREMSYHTHQGRSFQGREHKTLKQLKLYRCESFIIETKRPGTEWKTEVVYLDLYVNPLFPRRLAEACDLEYVTSEKYCKYGEENNRRINTLDSMSGTQKGIKKKVMELSVSNQAVSRLRKEIESELHKRK